MSQLKKRISPLVKKERELKKKLKRSKFNAMVQDMSDIQIKALYYCLIYDQDICDAIKCFEQAVEHGTQLEALKRSFAERGIDLKQITGKNLIEGE